MERPLTSVQKEVLALERVFPHHIRERFERFLFSLSFLFLSFSVFFNIAQESRFVSLWPISEGLFLVCFSLLLFTVLIETYFHALRMRLEKEHEMSFATLLVLALHHPKKKDLAKAFLHSHLGREVMARVGVARESINRFLISKDPAEITLPIKGFFPDLAAHLHDNDSYFRDFLDDSYVSKKLLVDAAGSVERKHHKYLKNRPLFAPLFEDKFMSPLKVDDAARHDIDEIESFYKVIITEQATQAIVTFFEDNLISYASSDARVDFLTGLIEATLNAHGSRFHGASVIMPADVRHYLIGLKASH